MSQLKEKLTPLLARQYLMMLLGSLIYACGQLIFIKPMYIPMGGVAGIALVLNYLWALPVGAVNLVCNIPLLFLGYRTMGRSFFFKTVFTVLASSLALDVLAPFLPAYGGESILAALYGGIIMGAGYGLVFRAGGTTGGIDILVKYFNNRFGVEVGSVNFAGNAVVIVASAIIYRNLDSALYAIIASYLLSAVLDKMVYGMDVQRSAMIITSRPDEVSAVLMEAFKHGLTALPARGTYSGEDKTVLLCAVRRHEVVMLKRLVRQIDSGAFLMLSSVSEVFGKNFKRLEE